MILPIPNYGGFYKISDDGVVYSIHRPKEKLVRPYKVHGGYLMIRLCKNGIHQRFLVHRLVLEAFIGPCPPNCEAAHLNGISDDNRKDNLIWTTKKENFLHRDIHGTTAKGDRHGMRINKGLVAGERNGRAKLTKSDIIQIRKLAQLGFTHKEISKNFGVKEPTIWKIVNLKGWRHIIEDGRVK